MNDQELKYLIALKDKIAERMGPWRVGDPYIIDPEPHRIRFYGMTDHFEPSHWKECGYDVFPIPLAIDPINPGRGLWGMVDWGIWKLGSYIGGGMYIHDPRMEGGPCFDLADTPYLALLKVLAAQWGIEVEK